MKTVYIFILSLVVFIIPISCSNNLDEIVYDRVTEQTYGYSEKDFIPTIASVYSYLRELPTQHNYFVAQEVCADAIVMPPNASGWDNGGVYRRMHYHLWNSEQNHVVNMWHTFYKGALLCNKVLEQLEHNILPAPNEKEKKIGVAEVRAMRAYYYWLICDNFGDAPLVTSSNMELPSKNTRREIYDFIEKELKEVIPDLTEDVGEKTYGRMTKWSAKTLLANLYLNSKVYIGEEHWKECIEQCDDIINSSKFELSNNYKDPFRSFGTETCKEIIFTIPFDSNIASGNYIYQFSWHGELKKKFETEGTPWGCGSAMGVTQFIDTYNKDDSRLPDSWLMGEQLASDGSKLYGTYDKAGEPLVYTKNIPSGNYTSEMEGFRMNKYEVEKGALNNASTTDIPLFRYAEILLMKAECLLRLGQPGAGALVTKVRQRAFKNNPELAVVTDNQLKENSCYEYGYIENYQIVEKGNTEPIQFGRMYDELGWEFAWEMHRRRDAIRFGVYTKKSWCSHKPEGEYRSVFPIPERVLTSNPNLEQNPNYL
ncbi:MAG: RagB/SusD family nutrient uptake outer membrane protein [Parabacteroides sp.]|nr:RagB/SusD family nutrient uptake outer membrane protein [Parabacteroides sp.]